MRPSPDAPLVTVVVVTWQGRHLVGPCLESLSRQTVAHRVLVVDNASTDGTADYLSAEHPEVEVLRAPVNEGFAGGAQRALAHVRSPYVALLNNDATAEPGWLQALVDHANAHPEAAAVTSRMLLADRPDTLNNTGVVLLATGYGADRDLGRPESARPEPGEVFGFSGGAALLRAAAAREIGGFPVRYFLYYEDTDLSWRLRLAGWTVRYEPDAVVRHLHSATVDQRSESFGLFNERNRLLTLTRCAPAGLALRALGRFLITTASVTARSVLRRHVPSGPTLLPRVRLRALASFLRLLPWALGTRRAIQRGGRRTAHDVVAQWAGRDG
jgi:GT2 family glycosyltransferase